MGLLSATSGCWLGAEPEPIQALTSYTDMLIKVGLGRLDSSVEEGALSANFRETCLCQFVSQIFLTQANAAPCKGDSVSVSVNPQPF